MTSRKESTDSVSRLEIKILTLRCTPLEGVPDMLPIYFRSLFRRWSIALEWSSRWLSIHSSVYFDFFTAMRISYTRRNAWEEPQPDAGKECCYWRRHCSPRGRETSGLRSEISPDYAEVSFYPCYV